MPEKSVQNDILEACGGLPFIRLWRQNTGAARYKDPATGKERWVRFGLPGAPDLTGVLRCGIRVDVEVKSETGTASEEQERYARMAAAFGVLYVLARAVPHVQSKLAQHLTCCAACRHATPYRPETPAR